MIKLQAAASAAPCYPSTTGDRTAPLHMGPIDKGSKERGRASSREGKEGMSVKVTWRAMLRGRPVVAALV